MGDISQCAWKMVDSDKFVLGQIADRCGKYADVKVLRPNRKTDLFLCEHHLNEFIQHWGLHNNVEILCQDDDDWCQECGLNGVPEGCVGCGRTCSQ